jgi:enoyl-CoA hydratase/carnithine racemase
LVESRDACDVLHLISADQMNRLTRERVSSLTEVLEGLSSDAPCRVATDEPERRPLIITGNQQYFSVGADLNDIAVLNGPAAFDFAKMGQRLMSLIEGFPAPVYAAISGYCMGGGFDLALACDLRICAANAAFGHRGAALGLITGWGGTQRLPRIVGRARALQMFAAAEKVGAAEALEIGLVSEIVPDPLARAIQFTAEKRSLYPRWRQRS